jgi:hypothetical protein
LFSSSKNKICHTKNSITDTRKLKEKRKSNDKKQKKRSHTPEFPVEIRFKEK